MIKKFFVIVIVGISFLGCSMNNKVTYLLDMDEYSDIKLENIESIEKVRYTEGGSDTEVVNNEDTYNYLKGLRIYEETNMACDDNTTIYKIHLNDGSLKSIEIECDWVVIGSKRYLLKK